MGVAIGESRIGGAPITNRRPQGCGEGMEILVLGPAAAAAKTQMIGTCLDACRRGPSPTSAQTRAVGAPNH
jgi:hypothetical protein